jgi:hypothetical protein
MHDSQTGSPTATPQGGTIETAPASPQARSSPAPTESPAAPEVGPSR